MIFEVPSNANCSRICSWSNCASNRLLDLLQYVHICLAVGKRTASELRTEWYKQLEIHKLRLKKKKGRKDKRTKNNFVMWPLPFWWGFLGSLKHWRGSYILASFWSQKSYIGKKVFDWQNSNFNYILLISDHYVPIISLSLFFFLTNNYLKDAIIVNIIPGFIADHDTLWCGMLLVLPRPSSLCIPNPSQTGQWKQKNPWPCASTAQQPLTQCALITVWAFWVETQHHVSLYRKKNLTLYQPKPWQFVIWLKCIW